jgi:transcriptional regulator with XRE-family HTH domain
VSINLKFGKRLRKFRKESGLTQIELAEKSGVDYKYLQKLEGKNPSSPTLETLEKLARGLKVTIGELVEF